MTNAYRTLQSLILAAALLPLASPSTLRAQGGPAITPAGDLSAGGLLDPEYRDDAHGIRLCPPAGVRMEQKAGTEVLSFVQDQRDWAGSIRFAVTPQDMTVKQYLQRNVQAMNATSQFKGVTFLKNDEIKVGDKPAGRQISAFEMEQVQSDLKIELDHKPHPVIRIPFYKQDVMVQMAPNQFVHLTLFTPARDKDIATRTFDAMLATFSVVDVNAFKKQMFQNVIVGKVWLDPLRADDLAPKLIPQPTFFRVQVQDKEVGYVRFDETQDTKDALKGVAVRVQSFTFPHDGTIVTSDTTAFWPFVGTPDAPITRAAGASSWQSVVRNWPPPAANPTAGDWTWRIEQGSIEFRPDFRGTLPGMENETHPSLIITVKTQQGSDKAMNLAFAPPPAAHQWAIDTKTPQPQPLPKVLEFLWPRMVDLAKPSAMSFPVYNAGAGKMGMRTLSVIGPESITIDGSAVTAIRLTDELETGATTLWVDHAGRTLMMRTSDGTTLLPTTQQQMDAFYGARLRRIH